MKALSRQCCRVTATGPGRVPARLAEVRSQPLDDEPRRLPTMSWMQALTWVFSVAAIAMSLASLRQR